MIAASITAMNIPVIEHSLYPQLEPYANGHLNVGDGHQLYFEQCGHANGMPMIFLHGGPGSACSPRHRQFFNPKVCRTVLFDQRGCGRSLPSGLLIQNNTKALVQDIESLRQHLAISKWLVVGGSWGAALALAYAQTHPASCLGLVLRGVFLGRQSDLNWFFKSARQMLPDAWQAFSCVAPHSARKDMRQWLYATLHGSDENAALQCALAWEAWEQSLSQHQQVPVRSLGRPTPEAALLLNKYRVQSHYLIHHCFLPETGLLSLCTRLAELPSAILHGRLDWICRPQAAWDLHHNLPDSRLHWIEGCGHSPFEPAMTQALVSTISCFAAHGNFSLWDQMSVCKSRLGPQC